MDGDEWFDFLNLRNRGGVSHEFGVMPRSVSGDSRIQAISLLNKKIFIPDYFKPVNFEMFYLSCPLFLTGNHKKGSLFTFDFL